MEEVSSLSLEIGVSFGHNLPLFLPIRRAVFLPREVALGAFQPFAFVAEVGTLDGMPVGVVGVLENPHVDTNDLLGRLWFFRRGFLHADAECGVPLARRFSFDRDLFDGRVLGNVAVEVNRNLANFAQPQDRLTTRILEFEARLIVGERPIFPRRFPLEHSHGASVLLLRFECGEVVVDALDDHLQHFRVNVSKVVPPRFEIGELSLHLISGGDLVRLVEFVEDVIVQLPTSIDVVQKHLAEGFRWVESILVIVLHLWLSFLDEFVQFLLNERGEVQVVVLNPLLLIVTDGNVFASRHNT